MNSPWPGSTWCVQRSAPAPGTRCARSRCPSPVAGGEGEAQPGGRRRSGRQVNQCTVKWSSAAQRGACALHTGAAMRKWTTFQAGVGQPACRTAHLAAVPLHKVGRLLAVQRVQHPSEHKRLACGEMGQQGLEVRRRSRGAGEAAGGETAGFPTVPGAVAPCRRPRDLQLRPQKAHCCRHDLRPQLITTAHQSGSRGGRAAHPAAGGEGEAGGQPLTTQARCDGASLPRPHSKRSSWLAAPRALLHHPCPPSHGHRPAPLTFLPQLGGSSGGRPWKDSAIK